MARAMAITPKNLEKLLRQDADNGVQQAGLFSSGARSVARPTAKELLQDITKPGTSAQAYTVTPAKPEKKIPTGVAGIDTPEVKAEQPIPEEVMPEAQDVPMQEDVQTNIPPVEDESLTSAVSGRTMPKLLMPEELAAQREVQLGSARQAPSPGKQQKAAGVEVGPANTTFYDDDGLAATVQAFASQQPDFQSVTIASIYEKALEAGVPDRILKNILEGKQEDITAKVGGDTIAERLAGLTLVHDANLTKVDEMMQRMARGDLNETEMLELQHTIATQDIIFAEMSAKKRDIARSMNVFKNVRDKTIMLTQGDLQKAIEQNGGGEALRQLAEKYVTLNSAESKNKLIETSITKKAYRSVVYMNQSILLTAFDTQFYNMAANAAFQIMDFPERAVAAGVGTLRHTLGKMFGKEVNPDKAQLRDLYARSTGLYNGIIDGVHLMFERFANDGRAKDAMTNPLKAENWLKNPDHWVGKYILDPLAFTYSIPFRGLGAADEFFSGIAQRIELHDQANRYGMKAYDEAIDIGLSEDEALGQAQETVRKLLTERPADIEASVQSWAKQMTLQADIARADPSKGAIENAVNQGWRITNKALNSPILKPIVLFSNTVTNLSIEGAARAPILNFLSPRYYQEFSKGGRHKDLAISRVLLGGSIMLGGYNAAMKGSITGQGPADTEDRKALQATGWQQFSKVLNKEDYSDINIKRLQAIFGEDALTMGSGINDGKIFVSLKRLEPANMTFMMGAAMADTIKFQQLADVDDSWSNDLQTMFYAGAAAGAEYTTSVPAMQAIAEIQSILGQRQTDGGDRAIMMLDALSRRYSGFLMNAVPIANIANSTAVARIEALIDPVVRDTKMTKEQAEMFADFDLNKPFVRGFFEAYNRIISRIPVMSGKLPALLDDYGQEIGVDKTLSWTPLTAVKGKRNELAETLVQIRHGLSRPQTRINGVQFTSDISQRFKQLYANEIKIDGKKMDKAVIDEVQLMTDEYLLSGKQPRLGVMQQAVNSIVSQYRQAALRRMFGQTVDYNEQQQLYVFTGEPEPNQSEKYGLVGDIVEYPDIAYEMVQNQNALKIYGR